MDLHFFLPSFQVFHCALRAIKHLNTFTSYTWSSFLVVSSQAAATSSWLTDVHKQGLNRSNHSQFLT